MKSLIKALKLIHRLEPSLIPINLISIICRELPVYIDMLLSAYVLDALIGGQSLREILPAVFIALGIRLLLKAAYEITGQLHNERQPLMGGMFDVKYSEVTLTMDYQELNSPRINNLRDRIARDDMNNWGIYGVYNSFSEVLTGLVDIVSAAAIAVPMFSLNAGSLIYIGLTAAALVLAARLNGFFVKKRQEIHDSYEQARSYSSYYLWGNGVDYKMGKDIRVYAAQPMIENAFREDETERNGRRRYISFDKRAAMFNGVFGTLLQGSSYAYVVLGALRRAFSAGQVVKFASALYSFWGSLSSLMISWAELIQTAKRLESTMEFLALAPKNTGKELPKEENWEFEFKNVSFTYPGGDKKALDNISCTLKKGERIAVVGLNGSGKTTFIKLLCRLYHPTEGEILLNGVNIEEYSFDSYISLLSVVFQDFRLFSFSLGENVGAGEDYDAKKAEECLKTAGFGERLASLEKGLKTPLYKNYDEGGIEISGGEAQKIALARALCKDAPFMILDEPTAALDPIAEYEIYSRFNGFTEDKGAVYISHRLSSCVFCDRIMVFEDGEIVQQGTHEGLLTADGLYSRLWDAQAKYYNK